MELVVGAFQASMMAVQLQQHGQENFLMELRELLAQGM